MSVADGHPILEIHVLKFWMITAEFLKLKIFWLYMTFKQDNNRKNKLTWSCWNFVVSTILFRNDFRCFYIFYSFKKWAISKCFSSKSPDLCFFFIFELDFHFYYTILNRKVNSKKLHNFKWRQNFFNTRNQSWIV